MTYQGMPKAGYWAMSLLKKLHKIEMARGDGYLVTRSSDQKKIQICLWHYSHDDREKRIRVPLTPDEFCTLERYSSLQDQGVRSFRIHLSGLQEGKYTKETWSVSRAQGSAYDHWMNMGSPKMLSVPQQKYLAQIAIPAYQYEPVRVRENGKLVISAVLDVLEVQIICLEKR